MKKKEREPSPVRDTIVYAAIALALLYGACWYLNPVDARIVPDDLIGKYQSADERYADRAVEINAVSINFATGDGQVSVGLVDRVKLTIEDGRMLYTIKYTVDDAKDEVSFFYEPGPEQVIRFKNQEKIAWAKQQ